MRRRHVGNDIGRMTLIALTMIRSPMNYNTSSIPGQVGHGLVVAGGKAQWTSDLKQWCAILKDEPHPRIDIVPLGHGDDKDVDSYENVTGNRADRECMQCQVTD